MSAHDEIWELRRTRGWTDAQAVDILLAFVEERNLTPQLRQFVRDAANDAPGVPEPLGYRSADEDYAEAWNEEDDWLDEDDDDDWPAWVDDCPPWEDDTDYPTP